jgi:hypothetical protein
MSADSTALADPAKLARAARIVRAALERQQTTTPQPAGELGGGSTGHDPKDTRAA